MLPVTISLSIIVPLGMELFNCNLAHLAYATNNCTTRNDVTLNNRPTENRTRNLNSNTNF